MLFLARLGRGGVSVGDAADAADAAAAAAAATFSARTVEGFGREGLVDMSSEVAAVARLSDDCRDVRVGALDALGTLSPETIEQHASAVVAMLEDSEEL